MDIRELAGKLAEATNIPVHDYENHTVAVVIGLTMTRLFFPALLFYRPVLAVVISLITDEIDGFIFNFFSTWTRAQYQLWDKIFDLWWYAALMLYSVKNFSAEKRNWLIGLLVFRLLGQVAYFVWPNEEIFLFFPNYFEAFFVICLLEQKWKRFDRLMHSWRAWIIYFLAFAIAMIREVEIHMGASVKQIW